MAEPFNADDVTVTPWAEARAHLEGVTGGGACLEAGPPFASTILMSALSLYGTRVAVSHAVTEARATQASGNGNLGPGAGPATQAAP
jgi:hypothetical protein